MKRLGLVSAALGVACTFTTIDRPPNATTAGAPSAEVVVTLLEARGTRTDVSVEVTVDVRGEPADLGAGDVLTLRSESETTVDFAPVGPGAYAATMPTGDVSLAVELRRNGALDRTVPVALPPGFDLSAPAQASRAEGVTLAWEPSPFFPMTLVATGAPCLPDGGFTVALEVDTGSAAIQPADLIASSGPCDVRVVAERGISANEQVRTVVVHTTP